MTRKPKAAAAVEETGQQDNETDVTEHTMSHDLTYAPLDESDHQHTTITDPDAQIEHVAATPYQKHVTTGIELRITALMDQAQSIRQEAVDRLDAAKVAVAEAQTALDTIDRFLGQQKPSFALEPPVARSTRQRVAISPTSGDRMPKGFWRDKVVAVLEGKGDGLKKGELIDALEIGQDPRAQAGLSNALMTMKKNNEVSHVNGVYLRA